MNKYFLNKNKIIFTHNKNSHLDLIYLAQFIKEFISFIDFS